MPSSARTLTRSALRRTIVTLTATLVLLGVADIADGATTGPARGAAIAAQPSVTSASVTPDCGNCGGGF